MKYRIKGTIYNADSKSEALNLFKKKVVSEEFSKEFVTFINTSVEEEIKNVKENNIEEYKIKYEELQRLSNSFIHEFSKKCNELLALYENLGK